MDVIKENDLWSLNDDLVVFFMYISYINTCHVNQEVINNLLVYTICH